MHHNHGQSCKQTNKQKSIEHLCFKIQKKTPFLAFEHDVPRPGNHLWPMALNHTQKNVRRSKMFKSSKMWVFFPSIVGRYQFPRIYILNEMHYSWWCFTILSRNSNMWNKFNANSERKSICQKLSRFWRVVQHDQSVNCILFILNIRKCVTVQDIFTTYQSSEIIYRIAIPSYFDMNFLIFACVFYSIKQNKTKK